MTLDQIETLRDMMENVGLAAYERAAIKAALDGEKDRRLGAAVRDALRDIDERHIFAWPNVDHLPPGVRATFRAIATALREEAAK